MAAAFLKSVVKTYAPKSVLGRLFSTPPLPPPFPPPLTSSSPPPLPSYYVRIPFVHEYKLIASLIADEVYHSTLKEAEITDEIAAAFQKYEITYLGAFATFKYPVGPLKAHTDSVCLGALKIKREEYDIRFGDIKMIKHAWISDFVVSRDIRRLGVGTSLMHGAEDMLQNENSFLVCFELERENHIGMRFLEYAGYKCVGETPDGHPLFEKDLRGYELEG